MSERSPDAPEPVPSSAPGEVHPATDPDAGWDGWGRWRVPFVAAVVLAVVAGVVLRFVTRSPLWLDEALSVNIARLPLGELPEALRQDGHPPLYYALLHGWMLLFGEGNVAVRAFSGLWAVALLPLTWVAARRVGGTRMAAIAVALLALNPWAIRYGTETRMYAMVAVLALAGWLLVDDALRRPTPARLAAIAAVVGALLWSHYWAMWFLIVAGIGLLVHARRAHRRERTEQVAASVRVIGAFVVGGLTFLPWLPSLLYQSTHTGTPWARPMRPTEMVVTSLADFGGGPQAEAVLLGWLLAIAVLVGLFGLAVGRMEILLDLRTRATARPFAVLVVGTLAVGCVVGYATGATYATRYAAVFFPFVILLAALGLAQFRSRPIAVGVLVVLLGLGAIGGVRNVVTDRSDAQRNVDAITSHGTAGDWVVYCPDQLGPSTSRLLPAGYRQVTYPAFGAPERVDWVDYVERLDRVKPADFANTLLAKAGGHRIFLVYSTNYDTHEAICPALRDAISAHRIPVELTRPTDAYEQSSVVVYEAAGR